MQLPLKRSFLNSLGVVVYVAVVANIMQNGDRIFGEMNSFLAPAAFLLLFTTSAAVVGSLVFGYPIALFLDGKKKEALQAAVTTVGCLVVETMVALFVLVMIRG